MRKCPKCKIIKDVLHFHKRRGIAGKSVYCRPCTSMQTLERQRLFKKKCIAYKGGKCVECGYDKCDSALEFHHLDPSCKDFSVGKCRLTGFTEIIKHELDKCILVCCLCHREIHAGIRAVSSVG